MSKPANDSLRILHTHWDNGETGWTCYLSHDGEQLSTTFSDMPENEVQRLAERWRDEIIGTVTHTPSRQAIEHADQHGKHHIQTISSMLSDPKQLRSTTAVFASIFLIATLVYFFKDELRASYVYFNDDKLSRNQILDVEKLQKNMGEMLNKKADEAPATAEKPTPITPEALKKMVENSELRVQQDDSSNAQAQLVQVEAEHIIMDDAADAEGSPSATKTESQPPPAESEQALQLKVTTLRIQKTTTTESSDSNADDKIALSQVPSAIQSLIASEHAKILRSRLKDQAKSLQGLSLNEIRKQILQDIATGNYTQAQRTLFMQVRLGSLAPWLTHDTQVTDQSLQHATHAVQSETRHILQSLKGIHSEHDMKRISKKVTQKIWDDALYGTASRPYGMIHYD